jgi:hypothetical protein
VQQPADPDRQAGREYAFDQLDMDPAKTALGIAGVQDADQMDDRIASVERRGELPLVERVSLDEFGNRGKLAVAMCVTRDDATCISAAMQVAAQVPADETRTTDQRNARYLHDCLLLRWGSPGAAMAVPFCP